MLRMLYARREVYNISIGGGILQMNSIKVYYVKIHMEITKGKLWKSLIFYAHG